jgi:hypothetical protein
MKAKKKEKEKSFDFTKTIGNLQKSFEIYKNLGQSKRWVGIQ